MAEETGCQIETRVILDYPAFHTRDDSDCIRLIRMAFKDLGIASTVEDGAGGFDANLLSRCGIELVGLATGYTANHTVKENLIVEDLIRAGEMVEKAALLYDQL